MHTNSLVSQHAIAAQQTIEIARQAKPDQLHLPTTCADWNLRQLLDHMTTENLGFAASARGHGADPAQWVGNPNRADPVSDYVAATEALINAFAEPGVLQRPFSLPLLTRAHEFTGVQAVKMQLADSVVHAWDVARTLDVPFTVDDDIAAAVLAVCEKLPDDETRQKPGAVFAPSIPVAQDASALDRSLALLGRSPAWPS